MISKELLSAVLNFEFIPATGKELLEHSFGYDQGLRTACIRPLKNDEWICVHNNELTFGFKDIRPEVLKNIPEGVYTSRTINIYELAHKCKEWAFELNYSISSCKRIDGSNHKFFEAWVQKFTYQTEETDHDYSEHLSYCVGDIEPEAVFNVCEYILNTKVSK